MTISVWINPHFSYLSFSFHYSDVPTALCDILHKLYMKCATQGQLHSIKWPTYITDMHDS